MAYYSIKRSDNLSEIGHYPQADLKDGYNPRDNGHFMVKPYEFPDFKPNLELELNSKAKQTNYLDSTAGLKNGFVVDGKLKEILFSFKLPKHHFYPIKVYQKGELLDYYWFHFIVDDFWDFLDKNKSYGEVFKRKNIHEVDIETTFPYITKEQVLDETKKHKLGKTRIGKIFMKKQFPNYDLYKTEGAGYHTIISESLKNTIEKEQLTGMEIKPFDRFSIDK